MCVARCRSLPGWLGGRAAHAVRRRAETAPRRAPDCPAPARHRAHSPAATDRFETTTGRLGHHRPSRTLPPTDPLASRVRVLAVLVPCVLQGREHGWVSLGGVGQLVENEQSSVVLKLGGGGLPEIRPA